MIIISITIDCLSDDKDIQRVLNAPFTKINEQIIKIVGVAESSKRARPSSAVHILKELLIYVKFTNFGLTNS